jgi:hypothetical protein
MRMRACVYLTDAQQAKEPSEDVVANLLAVHRITQREVGSRYNTAFITLSAANTAVVFVSIIT